MSLPPLRVRLGVLALILVASVAGCGGNTTPTPLHVAAVYIDGINSGDFRQACAQIQPAVVKRLWGKPSSCPSYFTSAFAMVATYQGLGGYTVVPHSYRGWREGDVRVASVKAKTPYGSTLTVRLVKTAGGYKLASVS